MASMRHSTRDMRLSVREYATLPPCLSLKSHQEARAGLIALLSTVDRRWPPVGSRFATHTSANNSLSDRSLLFRAASCLTVLPSCRHSNFQAVVSLVWHPTSNPALCLSCMAARYTTANIGMLCLSPVSPEV